MDWPKSPESLIQTFAEALPEAPTVERRKMFGFPAALAVGTQLLKGTALLPTNTPG